jgi:glutamyl-tRNA synthetase/glutamyl-Q tRNA(Asp) synthetase
MRTRFAPAPTGYLHLGHLANALYVWGLARARGAEVLLRIEDHDRQRCRPEYETALLEDLEWLGFVPDIGAYAEFRAGPSPFRQSDRHAVYQAHVELLRTRGHHVYACDCTRKDLAEVHGDAPDRETPYSGRCRKRGLTPGPGRGLRVDLADGAVSFDDLRLGRQTQTPAAQCGDLLLMDRLGNWTYQFAVVVDDLTQGIDLVIRGEDLLESTARQILLAELLGRSVPPRFFHHALIRKPSGEKLSKSSGDTGLRELRAAGLTPEGLLGLALLRVGLAPDPIPVPLVEALGRIPGS